MTVDIAWLAVLLDPRAQMVRKRQQSIGGPALRHGVRARRGTRLLPRRRALSTPPRGPGMRIRGRTSFPATALPAVPPDLALPVLAQHRPPQPDNSISRSRRSRPWPETLRSASSSHEPRGRWVAQVKFTVE